MGCLRGGQDVLVLPPPPWRGDPLTCHSWCSRRKNKAQQLIKDAYAAGPPTDALAAFATFSRDGLTLQLSSYSPDELSAVHRSAILAMLEENMAGPYGADWVDARAGKKKEMLDGDARYILAVDAAGALVGFLHYRFLIEEEVEVLYVYELQVSAHSRSQGLGRHLMQIAELWARKNGMKGVMLTSLRANPRATAFYERMKYQVDDISPIKVDPLAPPEDYNYEIYSKIWDQDARETLKRRADEARKQWEEEYDSVAAASGDTKFRL